MGASFKNEGTFTPDYLVIEAERAEKVKVKAGAGVLVRGTVVGKDGNGKFLKCVAAATDGSQVPDAILAEDVDASGGSDVEAIVYVEGTFDSGALTFGTGHTAATVKDQLRLKDIWLQTTVQV